MLTFDRLKLVSSYQNITNFNPSYFLAIPTKYGIPYYKYQQEHPFVLAIIANPRNQELTIEFNGKILKDDYPKLICYDTIYQCLQNICSLNICDLNINAIISDSKVCLCDVTRDIPFAYPLRDLKRHIKASIKSYDKWLFRNCQNNGLEIYNSVTTKRRFKRLIIYDKTKELKRAENRDFLQCLNDRNALLHQFNGKIRIEFNLRSMEQVRNYLHIPNNDLTTVLNSPANPLLEFFDEAINESSSCQNVEVCGVYNQAEKVALLEQCNYNLPAIEMRLREITPKNTSIRRKMESYKKLLQGIQDSKSDMMNIRNLIA